MVVITLTQISLYVRVDKENLLEFPLVFIYYLYMLNYLYLFTDPLVLHNLKEKKRKEN